MELNEKLFKDVVETNLNEYRVAKGKTLEPKPISPYDVLTAAEYNVYADRDQKFDYYIKSKSRKRIKTAAEMLKDAGFESKPVNKNGRYFLYFNDTVEIPKTSYRPSHLIRENKSDVVTIDIDFYYGEMSEEEVKHFFKDKYNIEAFDFDTSSVKLKGTKDTLVKYLLSDYYDLDLRDVREFYPQLLESKSNRKSKKINESLNEVTIRVDFYNEDNKAEEILNKYNIKVTDILESKYDSTANLTGTKENLLRYLLSDEYGFDLDGIKEYLPQLLESKKPRKLKENKERNYKKTDDGKLEEVEIDGYEGTWYEIDKMLVNGKMYYLMEHEEYGDETNGLVITHDQSEIYETYDDIETTLNDEGIIIATIELNESLNELTETGLSYIISNLIKDELDAVEDYTSLINTLKEHGANEFIEIVEHIREEENKHVGHLQAILEKLSPSSKSIEIGKSEAELSLENVDNTLSI